MARGPATFTLDPAWTRRLAGLGLVDLGTYSAEALSRVGADGFAKPKRRTGSPPRGGWATDPLALLGAASVAPVLLSRWNEGAIPPLDQAERHYELSSHLFLCGLRSADGRPVLLMGEPAGPGTWRYWLATLPAVAELLTARVFAPSQVNGSGRDGGKAVNWLVAWARPGRQREQVAREGLMIREAGTARAKLAFPELDARGALTDAQDLNLDQWGLNDRVLRALEIPFKENRTG